MKLQALLCQKVKKKYAIGLWKEGRKKSSIELSKWNKEKGHKYAYKENLKTITECRVQGMLPTKKGLRFWGNEEETSTVDEAVSSLGACLLYW